MNTTDTVTATGTVTRTLTRLGALLVAVFAVLGLATPAQAYIAPGPVSMSGTPGAYQATGSCGSGRITVWLTASAQNGFTNGQYVTYRYALYGSNGYRGTSGWAQSTLVPAATATSNQSASYPQTPLPTTSLNAARGVHWDVLVQVGWYRPGYGWQYSGWSAPYSFTTFIAPVPNNGWVSCTT